jgi:hypothetical protein
VSFGGSAPGVWGQALICAGVAVIGGVWAVIVGVVLLRDQSSGRPAPVPAPIVAFYTGTLVLLLGAAAFIASAWFSETTAGWVLLTILLVARPTYDESRQMIAERAVVALIVSDGTALVLMGTVAMVVAAVLQLQHARYAYFAVFVTAAIVLLDAQRGNIFAIDLQRVVYTLSGSSPSPPRWRRARSCWDAALRRHINGSASQSVFERSRRNQQPSPPVSPEVATCRSGVKAEERRGSGRGERAKR